MSPQTRGRVWARVADAPHGSRPAPASHPGAKNPCNAGYPAAGVRGDDAPTEVADEVERLLRLAATACRRRAIALGLARHDTSGLATQVDPADYRQVAGLHAARRRDFVLGRHALRSALLEFGASPLGSRHAVSELVADGALLPAADPAYQDGGAASAHRVQSSKPADRYRLPAGFTASVSHSRGLAVAVAVRTDRFRSLGVDLELGRLPARAAHLVLRPQERHLLGGSALGGPLGLLALFSAKEAAYKAFSPLIPELPAVLRAVRVEVSAGALFAWPDGHSGLRVRVNVTGLGPHGVFCWTAVPAGEAAA